MNTTFRIDRLQTLWLQQLAREHEDICLNHNVALPTPIFEISESHIIFGRYHSSTGILSLSRHLILNHPWPVVLQVLKHEMAHQLCTALSLGGKSVHGQAFQDSCERLGVLPEFRRPGVVVPDMVAAAAARSELSEAGRKCLLKIEKLLALGRSANQHEAALAMEKANAMLEKYHLNGLGEGDEHRYSCIVIDRKKKKITAYQKHICSILQQFFFVKIVLSQLYDPLCGESFKTIEVFGTRENVAIAEYCFHFLENRLALLWSANRGRFVGSTQTEKNSYYLGILRGFREKLEAQKRNGKVQVVAPQAGALILAEEQRLAWFVGMRYPRLRRASAGGAKVNGSTYRQGVEEGRQIILNDAVCEKESPFGGFLS